MTVTSVAAAERAALCDLLDELGPDAPTLCEGWRARDLAAHLAVRERRLDAAAGLVIPPLASHTASVQGQFAARPYPELVDLVRHGPPSWSPQRLAAVDQATNTLEYLVHHEDLRRAQSDWSPRPPDAARDAEVWRRLRPMARMLARRAPGGVVLQPPDAAAVTVKGGEPAVIVEGAPTELALFLFGRDSVAQVELRGPTEAVEALRATSFGV